MSKRLPRKKKVEPPQPVIQAPSPLPKLSRINSHSCLLADVFKLGIAKDHALFRVKRKYYKKLELSSDPSINVPQADKNLLRIYPKMKFLRIFDSQTMPDRIYTKFYHRMRRFSHAKLDLNFTRNHGNLFTRYPIMPLPMTVPGTLYDFLIENLKPLTRLNLVSLKIKIRSSNELTVDQVLILKTLMKSLKYMSNLKALSCSIYNPYRRTAFDIQLMPSITNDINDVSCKFQRLKKIEKLKLIFINLSNEILDAFTKGFESFPNLKTITLKPMDHDHGKELMEGLYKIQTLTSLTIFNFLEPNDILSLAMNIPSLKSLTIKNDWLFNSKDMPLLATIGRQGLGITRLCFNLPMDIDTNEDVEFVCNLLSAFSQIRTLGLHVRTAEESTILIPIGKQIIKLSQLQKLELGVFIRSNNGIPSAFLSSIEGLTDLKQISLSMKIGSIHGWDRRSSDIYNALKPLLLQSQVLKKLSINWDEFTLQCAESLKLIINEMKSLDTLHIRYLPATNNPSYHYKPSYKAQDKILPVFESLFGQTPTVIKEVDIVSCCHQTSKLEKIGKAVKSNNNIKNFMLTMNASRDVFFKHYLY